MNLSMLQQEVQRIFLENLSIEVPSPQHDLIESGMLDSLALVDLIYQIEARFNTEIDLETLDLEHWRSVASISTFLGKVLGNGQ